MLQQRHFLVFWLDVQKRGKSRTLRVARRCFLVFWLSVVTRGKSRTLRAVPQPNCVAV